jgi:rRNA processing protein Gar1
MDNDSLTYLEYAIYFLVSLSVTIWVGRTLFRSGRPFLVDAFHGNDTMADSVNNLLIIGFYLVNVGFMLLFLSSKEHPKTGIDVVEHLSKSVGVVVVVLGVMHFVNLLVLNSLRTGAQAGTKPQGSASVRRTPCSRRTETSGVPGEML